MVADGGSGERKTERERSGKRKAETDLVGIFRAKFYIGLMDITVTDTTHGYHVSQLLVLKCKLCDGGGVVTVVFVVLLYSWYFLVGDWRQNANDSVELQYRTDYQFTRNARYEKHEGLQ